MRSASTIGLAALLVLGFVTLSAPSVSADTTCGDIGCCHAFEKGKVFLRCVECVVIGNDWDVDTDMCIVF